MLRRAILWLLPLCAACGGNIDLASTSTDALGSAQFWIKSSVPTPGSTTGASFTLDAEFLRPGATSCATSTIGPCTINPCLRPPPSATDHTRANVVTVRSVAAELGAVAHRIRDQIEEFSQNLRAA